MKKEVLLQITSDIHIAVTGVYDKGEEETGIPESFEIESIESIYKDISPLMEYCNSFDRGYILQIIEEKVLEKL